MKVFTGVYVGNAVDSREIFVPFDPDLVIIKREGASAAVWKSSGLDLNTSSYFGPTSDILTGIKTLTTKAFTIGTGNEVNANGQTYYFVAFKAESNDIEIGSYTGDGTDSRNISWPNSHSAAPLLMWVKEEASTDPAIMRNTNLSGDKSTVLSSTPALDQTNLIQAMTSSNFQVGTDTKINADTVTYHYVAFFASAASFVQGSFTGNGVDNRLIEGLGIGPDFVLIQNNTTASDLQMRFGVAQGDLTHPLIAAGAGAANMIQNLYRDKIELGSNNAVNKNGDTLFYLAFKNTSWVVDGKYHISVDGQGYVIQANRNGRILYEKKPAPEFVNKFGSGDSSYRDSSFWQFWAQVNWRNGAKQLRFDDAGKFWQSQNVDVNDLEKLKLSKRMVSAGQIKADSIVTALAAFRASQSWWNANYTYRKQITITAPSTKQLPQNYPIVLTEDTAALVTASKMRSDRNDLRIVYWNGTSWVDLTRDYVAASRTVFPLQAAINAGASDNNYYLHYGYASEATSKQPSTEADWNTVYGMYGTTFDSNTLAVWHAREGSGNSLTDHDSTWDLSSSAGGTWATDGPYGRNVKTTSDAGEDQAFGVSASGELDVGSFTFEWWAKSTNWHYTYCQYGKDGDSTVKFKIQENYGDSTNISFEKRTSASDSQSISSGTGFLLNDGSWHHYAVTFNGTAQAKFYRDNSLISTQNFGGTSGIRSVNGRLFIFRGTDIYFAHARFSNTARTSFPYAIMPSEFTVTQGTETTLQPPASSFSLFGGLDDGEIYLHDGSTTWTLQFDARQMEWYDTGDDSNARVGDTAGTEYKQAQGFKVDANVSIKAVSLYMKATASAPTGAVTVRIETDNAGAPSGTLVDANATTTIANFTSTTAAWKEAIFPDDFQLTGTTLYWIVVQCDAQANDVGWEWRYDGSSPGYSDGNMSQNGGSWAAQAGRDAMFRVLGNATRINCTFVSDVGGTNKIFWGIGAIDSEVNGDARLISYDGTTWKLEKIFNVSIDAQVLSIHESKIGDTNNLFAAVGPSGRVYKTEDLTTWTETADIEKPQNPGYPYVLTEYNRLLYVGGGSPERLDDKKYNGFFYQFNQVDWEQVFPFDHTVIKSMQFYDAFLFVGTYHGQLFVFNTVTLDPLFSFKEDFNYSVQVIAMFFFDDKLWIGLAPQDGITAANESIWLFNRHGMHSAVQISGVEGYYSFAQANNEFFVGTGDDGYVYKLSNTQYAASGWLQTSYFDAILPSIRKLYSEFTLQFDPLPNGCSITVYYKFKESDSWTQLGSAINTSGAVDATLTFPSGILSKKISFKIELATSDPAQTPVVNEYVLKYSLYPSRKWMWNIRLLAKDFASLLDRTKDPRTGIQVMRDLDKAQQAEALNTFVDIDGKSYTVLFNSLDGDSWIFRDAEGLEDSVSITLLEA